MRKMIATTCAMLALAGFSMAGKPDPTSSIGALTAYAIHELNFDQGQHASDPSGDGVGRDGVEDRVGLANVVEKGNVSATLGLLVFLLDLGE